MNRRFVKRWLFFPCLLTGAFPTLQAQPISLEYSLTDGTAFDITEKVTQVTTATGADPVTDVRERKSRLTVKGTETGYANAVTVASQTLTRNGNAVVSPVHAAMAGLTLTYAVDPDGKLVEITGYDQLKDAMAAKLPEKLVGTLLKLLNYDTLRRQDSDSYNEIYGDYAGASIEIVADKASVASHALPYEGSVPLYAMSTTERISDDTMIGVSRTYNSDAAALAAQFETVTEESLMALSGTLMPVLPANHESVSVSGTETTQVHISGALVASRIVNLEYTFTLTAPPGGEAVPFAVSVTQEYTVVPVPPEATQTPETTQP